MQGREEGKLLWLNLKSEEVIDLRSFPMASEAKLALIKTAWPVLVSLHLFLGKW
jgi:hypothetical protein